MALQALIFDLDGTLIDSTHAYAAAAHQAFKDFGLAHTPDEFHKLAIGVPLKVWLQEKGVDETIISQVAARRDALVLDALRTETEWREGAQEALQYLSEQFPLAIVTGAWTSSVNAINERLNLRRFTSVIIDGDAVKPRFKPDPHGLNLAAKELQVAPRDAAYIGDQLFDMLAARNAGMQSILIPGPHTTLTEELQTATDRQWQDLNAFIASFAKWQDVNAH